LFFFLLRLPFLVAFISSLSFLSPFINRPRHHHNGSHHRQEDLLQCVPHPPLPHPTRPHHHVTPTRKRVPNSRKPRIAARRDIPPPRSWLVRTIILIMTNDGSVTTNPRGRGRPQPRRRTFSPPLMHPTSRSLLTCSSRCRLCRWPHLRRYRPQVPQHPGHHCRPEQGPYRRLELGQPPHLRARTRRGRQDCPWQEPLLLDRCRQGNRRG
jgi:hypothetical protein